MSALNPPTPDGTRSLGQPEGDGATLGSGAQRSRTPALSFKPEHVWSRGRIAELVGNTALAHLMRRVHDRGRRPLLLLAYHRVTRLPDPATYPFDMELISATPEEFEFQMGYLRRQLDPVPLSAVVDHLTHGSALPKRPVVVTFDDGFDDNLHEAGPILREYGIVPTIFLSTDYVGSTQPYFFEIAVYLMMRLPAGALRLPWLPRALPDGADWPSRRRSGRLLQQFLLGLSAAEIAQHTSDWLARFAPYTNWEEFRLSGLLGWDSVRTMDGNGYEFGSHSKSHVVLAHLKAEALQEELAGSKTRLEHELGHPVTTIAYPVGKEYAYSSRVQVMARDVGYRLGLAYTSGANWVGEGLNVFAMHRQNVERQHGKSRFRVLVDFPEWVHW